MTCAEAFGAPGQRRKHEEGNTSEVGPLRERLFDLTHLSTLVLRFCNRFSLLPAKIGDLKALTALEVIKSRKAVAEAAEEGVSDQLIRQARKKLLCLEQRAEKARALRVDASAVQAARLERAVAPESLRDEDTQTGDGPMGPAVAWASPWAAVEDACKEKGRERGADFGCLGCGKSFKGMNGNLEDEHSLFSHLGSHLSSPPFDERRAPGRGTQRHRDFGDLRRWLHYWACSSSSPRRELVRDRM